MLNHFDHQCRESGRATVVFFGGSITDGAHSSEHESTSWRALTSRALRERHPDAELLFVNAAVGGTGSDYGLARLREDVLSHRPDLVFVEFAVNDASLPSARRARSYEGVIRELRTALPASDIVALHTLARNFLSDYESGRWSDVVATHQAICEHYGVPAVNVGLALVEHLASGRRDWAHCFSDEVHPSDAGHAHYAATLIRTLEGAAKRTPGPLPPQLDAAAWTDGRILHAEAWNHGPEWATDRRRIWNVDMRLLACDQPGVSLEIPFTGRIVGLLCMRHAASGGLEWSIDGGPRHPLRLWDEYCPLVGPRPSYAILDEDLTAGCHLLQLTVSADCSGGSDGRWVDLFGLLTADADRSSNETLPESTSVIAS